MKLIGGQRSKTLQQAFNNLSTSLGWLEASSYSESEHSGVFNVVTAGLLIRGFHQGRWATGFHPILRWSVYQEISKTVPRSPSITYSHSIFIPFRKKKRRLNWGMLKLHGMNVVWSGKIHKKKRTPQGMTWDDCPLFWWFYTIPKEFLKKWV